METKKHTKEKEAMYYHVYKCKLCGEIFIDKVSTSSYNMRFSTLHNCSGVPFEHIQGNGGDAIARFKCDTTEEAEERLNFIKYFNQS